MKKLKWIIPSIIIASVLSFVALAETLYTPLAWENFQTAHKNLDEAQLELCLAHKELASSKVKDYYNGVRDLEKGESLVNLVTISEKKCYQEEPLDPKLSTDAPEHPVIVDNVDIPCLAKAVAIAETENCSTGMGVTRNNCFGIMTWDRGFREGKTYSTKDEAYADFRKIWTSYYGGFPTWQQAVKWTGNDRPSVWLGNVQSSYNTCMNEH